MPIALGFGIATNYTYAKAQTTNNYFMPYLSKHTVNVIPYYEQGPVSIRVSYGFRSKYFTSIGRLNASQFTDKYTELDASASYNFTSNLRLTLDASNLLDEKYFAFNGVQAAPIGIYRNGRLYSATVTYKF
jgi:iron complex outermembrane receptor protein